MKRLRDHLRRKNGSDTAEVGRLKWQIEQFGFDLHDEALQDVTALRNDLVRFRVQVDGAMAGSADRRKVVGRVDDFLARVGKLDADLRELAVAGRLPTPPRRTLSAMLAESIEAHAESGKVQLVLDLDVHVRPLTDAERVAIVRAVESALANVHQHGDGANARVTVRGVDGILEVEVLDDGRGFDVDESRLRATQENRLGLLGMERRMAAVGGTFDVTSRPGGPTCVTLRLGRRAPR